MMPTSYASLYWTNSQWLTKPHRFHCFFFTGIWWITVDMLVISVAERYFQLGLKYLIPLKEFKFSVYKLLY